jgi:hypothetical protein
MKYELSTIYPVTKCQIHHLFLSIYCRDILQLNVTKAKYVRNIVAFSHICVRLMHTIELEDWRVLMLYIKDILLVLPSPSATA